MSNEELTKYYEREIRRARKYYKPLPGIMSKSYLDSFLEELNPPNGEHQTNYPNHNSFEPSRTNFEEPMHSSYHSPTLPIYQPSNIPTYQPSEVPTYQPTQETQHFPSGYVPPNAHPSDVAKNIH